MTKWIVAAAVALLVIGALFLFGPQQGQRPSPEQAQPGAPQAEQPETQPEEKEEAEGEASQAGEAAPEEEEEQPAVEAPEQGVPEGVEVVQIRSFPLDGYVVQGGSAAFHVTLKTTGDWGPEVAVDLALDGRVVKTQTVTPEPGAERVVRFSLDNLDQPGTHTVSILGQEHTLSVIQPAAGEGREGQIPAEGKVLSERDGLTEPGIPGGQLVVPSLGSGPKTFNPYSAQETSSTDVVLRMHSGLVEQNPMNYKIEPGLAQSWEFSSDGLEITFRLREGIRFSDGEPLAAEDVVFTFEDIIYNCDIPNNYKDGLLVNGEPLQVEAVDPYTVKFTLPEAFRPVLNQVGAPILSQDALKDDIARTTPGAWRNYSLSHCAYVDNKEELTGALKQAIQEANPDLDDEGVSARVGELTKAVEDGFKSLSDAIQSQELKAVKGAALETSQALKELRSTLPEGNAPGSVLARALDELSGIEDRAQSNEWGTRAGSFNDLWNTGVDPQEIVGLGPFTLKSYSPEQQVVLERNPHYWKVDPNGVQLPYLERYVYRIVKDQNTALGKFMTGELDVLAPRPQDWPQIKKNAESKGWEPILGGPTFGTTFVVLNQDIGVRGYPDDIGKLALQTVFREVKFRQALAHSVDRRAMIENVYNGLGAPQWSPISVPSPFYDDQHPEDYNPYSYDLEKAGAMLEELDLVDADGDDVREITDAFLTDRGFTDEQLSQLPNEGERDIEFTLSTNQGNKVREQLSEMIATDFNEVGVSANFKPKDFNALVSDLVGSKYQAILIGLTGGVEPHSGVNVWRTGGHLHFWRYSAADNPPEWELRVNELLQKGAATYNFDEAKASYVEFQRLVRDHLPLIYLVNQRFLYVSKEGLGNNGNFRPNWTAVRGSFAPHLWWKDEARRTEKLQ